MPRKPKEAPIVCANFTWYLRRKPNGVYFADVRMNSKYQLGKPSLGTKDREEAFRQLQRLDHVKAVEVGLVDAAVVAANNDVTIEGGWALYIERCEKPELLGGVSRKTVQRYKSVRYKHQEYCAKKSLQYWSQITRANTLDYGATLAKKKYADRTIVCEANMVCSVSKWLTEEGHLPQACRFLLKMTKVSGSSTFCYTRRQVARMIEFCNETEDLVWMGQVITCLATSGLRINELAQLRWSDVDLDVRTIRITDERSVPRRRQTGSERRIKGKRGRALPMHAEFFKVLQQIPRQADGRIFHGPRGGRLSDRRVLENLQQRIIQPLTKEFPTPPGEIGFQSGTVHGLRHFFCSEAYRNGARDAELLEWLGHRDSEMTQLYRHLLREDSHRRMEQINFLRSDDEEGSSFDVA